MSIATAGIRLAEMAEAESISHLSRDTIEAGLPWRWQPADIERYMRTTRHNVIVAEETALDSTLPNVRDGKVMSGFAVMGYGDNDAYLALLSVRPEWRRKGIARAMTVWLLKCADVSGIKRVDVELRADNMAARGLYQAAGFREIARKPGGYYGTVTQLRLRLVLRK
jgi:ribosomal-protein-alanine N-acetyltransferase